MKRKRVGLATYPGLPDLDDDERALPGALREHDIEATPVVWSDEMVQWASFDAVIVRSCWDYHLDPEGFLRWIGRLEGAGVPLWNSPEMLRWNLHKTYLRELEARGARVIPTVWLERGSQVDFAELLSAQGWDEAIVKPSISLNAHQTWRGSVRSSGEDQKRLNRLLSWSDVMVQRFAAEVVSEGEWSLVFIDGAYSHAVVKRPASGDFRVGTEQGGAVETAAPPPDLVRQGESIVGLLEGRPLYARVDGILAGGQLTLMELELIEPSLFFLEDRAVLRRFAAAAARLLTSNLS